MKIGEELQMAVQRSSKLGTLFSGLFDSDTSIEAEGGTLAPTEPNDGVDVGEAVADNEVASEHGVASHEVDSRERAQTDDSSGANGEDGASTASNASLLNEEVALIESAKEDPAAFGALYERYVDRVYAYIYHRVSNTQEAEDLTARTFYRALSRLHTYEDRGYPFSAWLFRIAHNLVANWHRDRSRRRFLSLDRIWSHSHDGDTPEHAVEKAERSNALWDAIDRLPKDRRELIFYKFGSRLSNVEIGEMMNKSESAIKSLYFRTLAALRSDLEKDDL